MPTDVKGCKGSASLKDWYVLHVKKTLGCEIKWPDILDLLDISLISRIEQKGPVSGLRSKSGINDLKLLEVLSDVVEVYTVLNHWVAIHPESLKVRKLFD